MIKSKSDALRAHDGRRRLTISSSEPSIAVLIPCLNEEHSIANVVRGFRKYLPAASIYVYDNKSSDRTIEVAAAAGAICRTEEVRGKGNVVRRMFADVEADIYILVDGDDTYDAQKAPDLIMPVLRDGVDMVNAARKSEIDSAFRRGHRFGNRLLTFIVASIFGNKSADVLSGYRAFSRRYVKSFPAISRGFEIETELTVHALELRLPFAEIVAPYRDRLQGSVSKLRTLRDGLRILRVILLLVKEERPFQFFGTIGLSIICFAILLFIPLFRTYLETGLVPRLPTAVLAAALSIVGLLALASGIILDTVTRGRRENKRMHYLAISVRSTHPRDWRSQPPRTGSSRQAQPRWRAHRHSREKRHRL